jgi:recombination protein RecA
MGLNVTEKLTTTGAFDIIVIDSVANLVPKKELEADMGKQLPGLQARMMAQALRKLTAIAEKTNTTIIFINQIRYKIGVMFGSPETTPGGNALKFYCSMRLDIRRTGKIQKDGEFLGCSTKVTIVKNKVAAPFKKAEFNILFGQGVDRTAELIDLAIENNVVKKSGSWFSYNGAQLGQGSEKVKALFLSQPDIREEIETKVFNILFPSPTGVSNDKEEATATGS